MQARNLTRHNIGIRMIYFAYCKVGEGWDIIDVSQAKCRLR